MLSGRRSARGLPFVSLPALRPRWTPRRRLLSLPRTSSGARETCGPPCGVGSAAALDQVGLGYPPGQAGGGDPARLGLRSCAARCQRSSFAERQSSPPLLSGAEAGGSWCRAAAAAVRAVGCRSRLDPRRGSPASVSAWHGGGGRSRTVEAYAVPLAHVSGLRGFRFRSVLGRVAVAGNRPAAASRPGSAAPRRPRRPPGGGVAGVRLLLDRLRIGGVRVAAVPARSRRSAAGRRSARSTARRLRRARSRRRRTPSPRLLGTAPAAPARSRAAGRTPRLGCGAVLAVAVRRGRCRRRVAVGAGGLLPGGRPRRWASSGRAALLAHQRAADRVQLADVVAGPRS